MLWQFDKAMLSKNVCIKIKLLDGRPHWEGNTLLYEGGQRVVSFQHRSTLLHIAWVVQRGDDRCRRPPRVRVPGTVRCGRAIIVIVHRRRIRITRFRVCNIIIVGCRILRGELHHVFVFVDPTFGVLPDVGPALYEQAGCPHVARVDGLVDGWPALNGEKSGGWFG